MGYNREDAHRLAQAVYRKRQYDERSPEPTRLSALLDSVVSGLKRSPAIEDAEPGFENPDLTYLVSRSRYSIEIICYVLGDFDEWIVVEALRQGYGDGHSEQAYLRATCRRILAEEAP